MRCKLVHAELAKCRNGTLELDAMLRLAPMLGLPGNVRGPIALGLLLVGKLLVQTKLVII